MQSIIITRTTLFIDKQRPSTNRVSWLVGCDEATPVPKICELRGITLLDSNKLRLYKSESIILSSKDTLIKEAVGKVLDEIKIDTSP